VNIVKCTEYIFRQKKSELCLEIHKNANETFYALLPLIKVSQYSEQKK